MENTEKFASPTKAHPGGGQTLTLGTPSWARNKEALSKATAKASKTKCVIESFLTAKATKRAANKSIESDGADEKKQKDDNEVTSGSNNDEQIHDEQLDDERMFEELCRKMIENDARFDELSNKVEFLYRNYHTVIEKLGILEDAAEQRSAVISREAAKHMHLPDKEYPKLGSSSHESSRSQQNETGTSAPLEPVRTQPQVVMKWNKNLSDVVKSSGISTKLVCQPLPPKPTVSRFDTFLAYGVPESGATNWPDKKAADKKAIVAILAELGIDSSKVISTYRFSSKKGTESISKSPTGIRVFMSSEAAAQQALRLSHKLSTTRYSNVFIRRDLSKEDREIERQTVIKKKEQNRIFEQTGEKFRVYAPNTGRAVGQLFLIASENVTAKNIHPGSDKPTLEPVVVETTTNDALSSSTTATTSPSAEWTVAGSSTSSKKADKASKEVNKPNVTLQSKDEALAQLDDISKSQQKKRQGLTKDQAGKLKEFAKQQLDLVELLKAAIPQDMLAKLLPPGGQPETRAEQDDEMDVNDAQMAADLRSDALTGTASTASTAQPAIANVSKGTEMAGGASSSDHAKE